MVLKNNCRDLLDFIISVNCYNGRFVIGAKSLETNVAVNTKYKKKIGKPCRKELETEP
jgi:hypothetical protein